MFSRNNSLLKRPCYSAKRQAKTPAPAPSTVFEKTKPTSFVAAALAGLACPCCAFLTALRYFCKLRSSAISVS